MKNREIKIGSKVSIQRPDDSFSGQVTDTRPGWVKVYGKAHSHFKIMNIDNLRKCLIFGEQFQEALQEFDVIARNPYCTLDDDLTFLRNKLSELEKKKLAQFSENKSK